MKEGWRMVKLGEVCKIIAGQSPKGSSYNTEGIGVEFHQGKKAFGEIFIEPSNVWTTEVTKMAEPGDILMSVRAPVGPTNFTDRQVCIGRGLAAIRCTQKTRPQFVLYALKNIESKIVGKDGAVFSSINKDMIENLPIPVLSLPEQERIVSILDAEFAKIDAVNAGAEKSLQHAKDLFQAVLKKELTPKEGWETKTIESCFVSINNGANIKQIKGAQGLPITRIETLSNDVFNRDRMGYADIYDPKEYAKYLLNDGDILMSHINSMKFLGRAVVYEKKDEGEIIIHGMNLLRLVPISELNSKYASYYFSTKDFRNQILSISHQSINQASFNVTALKTLNIPLPPLPEQEQIVARLDTLNTHCKTLQANYERTIALCDDMKQALLRKAFNGEL